MQALIEKASANINYLIYAAMVIVVLLLGWIVLRTVFGHRVRTPGGGRTRQPRLGVVYAYDLDRQRQLVLVRRDNVEHLIMIGGPNDLLLESTIVRAGVDMRSRSAPSAEELAQVASQPQASSPPVAPPAPEPVPAAPLVAAVRAPAAPSPPPVARTPIVAPPPPMAPPPRVTPPPPSPAPVIAPTVTTFRENPPPPAPVVAPPRPLDELPPKPKFEFPRLAPRPPETQPALAPKPVIEAPKPVVEALKPFEPAGLAEAANPAGADAARAKLVAPKSADPLEALEEEMAKLLGRPPGAGAPKS